MRSLRIGFAVMMATAAVVPLLTYGVVSIYTLRAGTRRTVTAGNLNVARQVGEHVRRYVSTNLQIFQALAADVENTGITVDRQDRILKNFVLRFPEFRELTIFDSAERQVASSRVGIADTRPPRPPTFTVFGVTMTPVVVDGDLLPTTVVAVPLGIVPLGSVPLAGALSGTVPVDGAPLGIVLPHAVPPGRDSRPAGWLVGQFSIEELWRLVGRVRIGQRGFVLLIGAGGELLAHGNPNERPRVARGENVANLPIVLALRQSRDNEPVVSEDATAGRERMLTVGVRIPDLNWQVLVEQPVDEAFVLANRQERELLAAIGLALLTMVLVGSFWGRTLIKPIDALIRATQAVAAGRLDARVAASSQGELGRLGTAFNSMADRLVQLQDDVRRQERHAVFGRVAAGLVHDLSHPFLNIHNNCRLLLQMYADAGYRDLFKRTVDREFSTIKRVFEDLRHIASPMPLERFPLNVSTLVGDVAEAMRANAEGAGLVFEVQTTPEALFVEGDVFALGRVCRNLILNAIEATPPQGRVRVTTGAHEGRARICVSDTGCGIAPDRMAHVFEDFTTTKRHGLGLGLAICRQIVEQLGGTIAVRSGGVSGAAGTTFVVEFAEIPRPRADAGGDGE